MTEDDVLCPLQATYVAGYRDIERRDCRQRRIEWPVDSSAPRNVTENTPHAPRIRIVRRPTKSPRFPPLETDSRGQSGAVTE